MSQVALMYPQQRSPEVRASQFLFAGRGPLRSTQIEALRRRTELFVQHVRMEWSRPSLR